jgi:predicted amidohydrolase YtcJ
LLIRDAEVGGRPGLDVRVGETVLEVGVGLSRRHGEPELAAEGGALLPGLHDHHVHLRAWAAARASVPLAAVRDPDEFDRLIRAVGAELPEGGWLRGVGWHEGSAGELDRRRLDALTGGRPARVQHRTGALWVLNSAALRQTGDLDAPGFERDAEGEPTGRLWRLDGWLRERVPAIVGDLAALAREAAGTGVTGFTDATPGRDQADVDDFARVGLPQRLTLMAPPGLVAPPGMTLGAQKLMLDDDTLPTAAELAVLVADSHRRSTPVAVHCVTAEQLIIALAAIDDAGSHPGDRVEHAGIVPPGFAARLARAGVAVVTNPGFLAERGDDYVRDVEPAEQSWLYPARSLVDAGVALAAATDAPFGPADPWVAIQAASRRRTAHGRELSPDERLTPAEALELFLKDPADLTRTRTVAPGEPGDLCLLRAPLATVLADPSADWVETVILAQGTRMTLPASFPATLSSCTEANWSSG